MEKFEIDEKILWYLNGHCLLFEFHDSSKGTINQGVSKLFCDKEKRMFLRKFRAFYETIREEEDIDQREDYASNLKKFLYESTTHMEIPFLRVEYTDQKGPERFIISGTGIPKKEILLVKNHD